MSVTVIEVCTHFQSFTSTEWCQIILHLSLRGLYAYPWYTADKLHCEVLILLISKEKTLTRLCSQIMHCSHQIRPAWFFLTSGSVFSNDLSRLWNATKKWSQDSEPWFLNTIHAAQLHSRSHTCLEELNEKYKISNRGGALGVFFHLVA